MGGPGDRLHAGVEYFGSVARWSGPIGIEHISSDLLAGSSEAQLGALRHVWLGDLGFVEQLDGLDDDRKLMKWRVVSHQLKANPFFGSLLEYKGSLRLHEVTVEDKTFIQLDCSFQTEHENAELMRRELKSRQEANIRGLLSLMEVHQALRGAQPVGPLQPNLVSVPRPPGASTAAPTPSHAYPGHAAGRHAAAAWELSPRSQAVMAGLSLGQCQDYLTAAPMASAASSLNSAGWGSSLENAAQARGTSGLSAVMEQTLIGQGSPSHGPPVAASVHDSANTVGSSAMNKPSSKRRPRARRRPRAWRPRANDDMLVAQRRRAEPESLTGASRVLSL